MEGTEKSLRSEEQPRVIARRRASCAEYSEPAHGTGETGEPRMNDAQKQNCEGNERALAWRAANFEVQGQGIAGWIAREAAAAWAACGAFEWVALGYLAASSALVAVFANNLAHPARMFGVKALVA